VSVVGSDDIVICLRVHQSKQSQTPFLLLSTSGFASESTRNPHSLDLQIRIRVHALNGRIHLI